jgi:hypothetical protein
MKLGKRIERRDALILSALILLGAGIGYFFNNFMDNFSIYPLLDPDTFHILIFLAGLQIGTCTGLIINPKTRMGGILILSIASIVLMRWYDCVFLYLDSFLVAILISVSLSILSAVGLFEKAPSHISIVTLTALFLLLIYYIFKLALSGMGMSVVGLAALISAFVYVGCIRLVKGDK